MRAAAKSAKKRRPPGISVVSYEVDEDPKSKRRLVLATVGPPESSLVDAAVLALADLWA